MRNIYAFAIIILISLFLFSCGSEKGRKIMAINHQNRDTLVKYNEISYRIRGLYLPNDSIIKEYDKIPLDSSELKIKFVAKFKTEISKLKKIHDSLMDKKYDSINKVNAIKEKIWNRSKAGKLQKKHPDWSKEECDKVADNEIWIGMDIHMVIAERGSPEHINVSNYGSGKRYQYCWSDYNTGYFYCEDDGIVTSYN